MLVEELHNISIEELFNSNKISTRAYTCCCHAEFKSLFDIISFHERGFSFKTIRNAGHKTYFELENLCKETINQITNFEDAKYLLTCNIKVDTFDLSQKKLIEEKYSELLNVSSVRTRNGLKRLTVDEFINYYLNCNIKELFKLKNIGKKSINEVIALRIRLNEYIQELMTLENLPLKRIGLETIKKYGNICDNSFAIEFYEKNGHFPMFWILEQNLKDDKSIEIDILLNSYKIYYGQQLLTLNKLAQKHNLTRERIRQIRNNVFYKTFEITDDTTLNRKNTKTNIHYLSLQNKEDWAYLLKLTNEVDILCHETIEVQNLLKEERCNFSFEFCLHLIAYMFRDIYTIIGGIGKSRKSTLWNNTYIIKKEYVDIFDFDKMIVEFSYILSNNKFDYVMDLEDYVANSQCWIHYDYDKNDSIIRIVREFLLYEFHLYSDDLDGLIKIPANKKRKPIEVIYEILQTSRRPMHIHEIFKEFRNIFPDHKFTDAAQLRPYLQRHEAISYRNRKSVYTLKEWDHIKTGTIRETIMEFLSQNDLPQTAENITEYVLQYFPGTNIASVRTSMINDTQKRFALYKNNLFGLKYKKYLSNCELNEPQQTLRKSFEQRLLDIELYILEEGHFPFPSNQKSKEASLGRWWQRIINNLQKLNDKQQAEVNRVKKQYAEYDTDKTIHKWNLNYNKLKCFILENRRLPLAFGDEKLLYDWMIRVKLNFHNYKLTEEQRQKYIALTNLI